MTPAEKAMLVAKLRGWLETPRINEALLVRGVFASAMEIGMLHESMHEYNPRGLASITARMLSNPHVRIRLLALAPDRRAARPALDSLLKWAKEASNFNPAARAN